MNVSRPVVVLVAATAALVAGPAATASAQIVTHLDRTHDVRSLDGASASPTYTRETRVAEGDVESIRIRHARDDVTVTVKFRELRRGGPPTLHDIYFRTDAGILRDASVLALPGAWYGHQQMSPMYPNGSDGAAVHCSGMRHAIDYVRNKVTLTVPRSCLGNPRWVQVDEDTARVEDNGDTAGSHKVYTDDAFSPYVSDYFHWSPKVHRG